MTAHPQGHLTVTAGGREFTLFVGMSVLAELQAKHGQDVLERLNPPEGASEAWMPDLSIVTDLVAGALQRFHEGEVSRWDVDDIVAENPQAWERAIKASFPDAEGEPGKPAGPQKAP